jgi:hypothetical protein
MALELEDFHDQVMDGLAFCSKTYELFEEISGRPDGTSILRLRHTKVAKKLIEELLPISRYVQYRYRTGLYIGVRWLNGVQSFDAELTLSGGYVDQGYFPRCLFVEVTQAMHANDYLARQMLDRQGFVFGMEGVRRLNLPGQKNGQIVSEPVGRNGNDFVLRFGKIVLDAISKKTLKKYPENTILIVECQLDTIYMDDEWELLVETVGRNLPPNRFREIYVFDSTLYRAHSFYANVNC